MPTKSTTDWDSVELDYRAGILHKADICQKHNISYAQLNGAAESRGWTQIMLSAEDEATVLGLAEQPRFPIDSIFTNDDVKRQALMTAGQMVRVHRKDIAKMRGIAATIMERLENFITDPDNNENVKRLVQIVGKNEWASDLLEKLSRILTRTIELERQAYGLDTMTIVPDDEEENAVAKEIRKLSDRLALITEQKAQRVEIKETKNDVTESSEE